jgi:uncharacterized phage-like protein YoqJ
VALERLRKHLKDEIYKSIVLGHENFIMGACYGFDLIASEIVPEIKGEILNENQNNIHLIAAVPFKKQAEIFSREDRDLYLSVLKQSDQAVTLNDSYQRGCYYERNRWMVECASRQICYFDGKPSGTGYTVKYARKKNLDIVNLYDIVNTKE